MDSSQITKDEPGSQVEAKRLKDSKTMSTSSEDKASAKVYSHTEVSNRIPLSTLLCKCLRSCCRNLRKTYAISPETAAHPSGPILPPAPTQLATLILDLDETLIHTSFEFDQHTTFSLSFGFKGTTKVGYVSVRPGLSQFLTTCAANYELVIFTASDKEYADAILDEIDPNRLIKHRLHRGHCVYHQGLRLKDLSRLGRDLRRTIIVDVMCRQNESANFVLQPDNGVKIAEFRGDQEDSVLLDLLPVLEKLKDLDDVRPVICRSRFIHEPLATSIQFL